MTPARKDSGSTLTLHHSALEQLLSGDSVTTTLVKKWRQDCVCTERMGSTAMREYLIIYIDRDYHGQWRCTPSFCETSNRYCCETLSISAQIDKRMTSLEFAWENQDDYKPLYILDEEPPSGYSLYKYPSSERCQESGFDTFSESDLDSSPESYGLHAILIMTGKIMSSYIL